MRTVFFFFIALLVVEPRLALSQTDVVAMARFRRLGLLESHHELVDRYNNLLNKIAFVNGVKTKNRRPVRATKWTKKNLEQARDALSESLFLGHLKSGARNDTEFTNLSEELYRITVLIQNAEEAWFASIGTSKPVIEMAQTGQCLSQAENTAAPISPSEVGSKLDPILLCLNAQKTVMDGEVLTYDGLEPLDKKKLLRPLKIKELKDSQSLVAQKKDDEKVVDTKPAIAVVPKPTPPPKPAPQPKPVKLSEDDQAKLALLPPLGDAPLVEPPSKKELMAQAYELLANFDKNTQTFDQLGFDLGAFSIAKEARSKNSPGGLTAKYRYSLAINRWKKSVEKYKNLDRSIPENEAEKRIQALLKNSHEDYWTPFTRKNAQMTDVLLGEGGNCDEQSSFIPSLQMALGIKLPPGQKILLQVFTDHIQPVIYDEKKNTVLDLAHGTVATGTPVPLYDPLLLVNGWLKKENPVGLARPESDFLIVKANVAPDPKLLAKLSDSVNDKRKTNSVHDLPNPGVLWQTAETPVSENGTMSVPDILNPRSTDYKSKSVRTSDGVEARAVDAAVQADVSNERWMMVGGKFQHVRYFHHNTNWTLPNAHYITTQGENNFHIQFNNKDDAIRASQLTNELDLFSFIAEKEIETTLSREGKEGQLQYPTFPKSVEDLNRKFAIAASELNKPLDEMKLENVNYLIQIKADLNTLLMHLTPEQKKQVVERALPQFSGVSNATKDFVKRIQSDPLAALKLYVNRDGDALLHSLTDVYDYLIHFHNFEAASNLQTDPVVTPIYKAMLDTKHVAWTKSDLKEKKNKNREPDETNEPTPTPKPPELPKSIPEEPNSNSTRELRLNRKYKVLEPTPTPTPTPKPKPSYVPEKPIVIKRPNDAAEALKTLAADHRNPLSDEEREAVLELWTPHFTAALIKNAKTSSDLRSLSTGFYNDLKKVFPQKNQCEIRVWRSLTEDGGCVPRELARLQLLALEALPQTQAQLSKEDNILFIDGSFIKISTLEYIDFLKAQLDKRPFPDWYTKARAKIDRTQ